MDDEWRVEVELGGEEHGLSLGERLRTLDLDDEARERLGQRVVVTRQGARMFLYARSVPEAEEAERVIRRLAAEDGVDAATSITRWDEERDEWVGLEDEERRAGARPAAPGREAEEKTVSPAGPGREAEEPAGKGASEWEARIMMSSALKAFELERQLREEGLEVRRRWRFVLALAPSEEAATALASRLRAEVPDAEWIDVERAVDLVHPAFVVLGAAKPEIARDLGL